MKSQILLGVYTSCGWDKNRHCEQLYYMYYILNIFTEINVIFDTESTLNKDLLV